MLFKLSIVLILFTSSILFAQDGLIKSYYGDGTLKSEITLSNNIRQGLAKFYYPNGNIRQQLNYNNGAVDGVVKEYYENGRLKELYTIENGRREGAASIYDTNGNYIKDINYISGILQKEIVDTSQSLIANVQSDTLSMHKTIMIDSAKSKVKKEEFDNSDYYTKADVMPEPVGGLQTILNKLVYSPEAKKNKIKGIVEVLADIDEYGEVNYAKVIKGIGYGCDESAKIAVFYTQFKPGTIKGKPVKVEVVIPVEFNFK